jgi:hypothetical protein
LGNLEKENKAFWESHFPKIKRSETLENLTIETPEVGWWVDAKTGS